MSGVVRLQYLTPVAEESFERLAPEGMFAQAWFDVEERVQAALNPNRVLDYCELFEAPLDPLEGVRDLGESLSLGVGEFVYSAVKDGTWGTPIMYVRRTIDGSFEDTVYPSPGSVLSVGHHETGLRMPEPFVVLPETELTIDEGSATLRLAWQPPKRPGHVDGSVQAIVTALDGIPGSSGRLCDFHDDGEAVLDVRPMLDELQVASNQALEFRVHIGRLASRYAWHEGLDTRLHVSIHESTLLTFKP